MKHHQPAATLVHEDIGSEIGTGACLVTPRQSSRCFDTMYPCNRAVDVDRRALHHNTEFSKLRPITLPIAPDRTPANMRNWIHRRSDKDIVCGACPYVFHRA